jgi:hypothetical protein
MTFLDGDNLVVFYILDASDFYPHERGGLWWEEHFKKGNTLFAVYRN